MSIKIRGIKVEGDVVGANEVSTTIVNASLINLDSAYINTVSASLAPAATSSILSLVTGSNKTAVFDYHLSDVSSNASRAGIIRANWHCTNLNHVETTIPDLGGSTNGVELCIDLISNKICVTAINNSASFFNFRALYKVI